MNERMDAEGQNGAKRHVETAHMSEVMYCGTSKCSIDPFLLFFYMIYLSNLFVSPFFAYKQKKTKPSVNHI